MDAERIKFLKSELERLKSSHGWVVGYLIHAYKAELAKLEAAKKSKKSR